MKSYGNPRPYGVRTRSVGHGSPACGMYRSATWYVPSGMGIRMPRSTVTGYAGAGRP